MHKGIPSNQHQAIQYRFYTIHIRVSFIRKIDRFNTVFFTSSEMSRKKSEIENRKIRNRNCTGWAVRVPFLFLRPHTWLIITLSFFSAVGSWYHLPTICLIRVHSGPAHMRTYHRNRKYFRGFRKFGRNSEMSLHIKEMLIVFVVQQNLFSWMTDAWRLMLLTKICNRRKGRKCRCVGVR